VQALTWDAGVTIYVVRDSLAQVLKLLDQARAELALARIRAIPVRIYEPANGPLLIELNCQLTVAWWQAQQRIEVFQSVMQAATALHIAGPLHPTEHIPAIRGRARLVNKELSPRDRELLYLLTQGLSNKEIATRVGAKAQTIKNRLSVLYAMLGVNGRVQAVVMLNDTGLHLERAV
jgi:DNA-binding NarL/FixJ family response regulator